MPLATYFISIPKGVTKLLLTTGYGCNDPQLKKLNWTNTLSSKTTLNFNDALNVTGITVLSDCLDAGWYGCTSAYTPNITDLPESFKKNTAITLLSIPYAFHSGTKKPYTNGYVLQYLTNTFGQFYQRYVSIGTGSVSEWIQFAGPLNSTLFGKTVAIIGDSISTNGDYSDENPYGNVPEIIVSQEDVGKTLSAYVTYYDINKTIGGHTITSSDVGTELTFTPVANDIGITIGQPFTYNQASKKVWWEVVKDELGIVPIPVCWSGSSITSHEDSIANKKTSYAWHDAQIRKCGIRTPGTMNRTAPDIIIIYRGTNDFSHEPYTILDTSIAEGAYPTTDLVNGNYGFVEGLMLTIKKIRMTYPNTKIFLSTLNVFKRINYSTYPTNNGTNTLPQYNNAIRKVADSLGCGLIEFDKDGITFENCYSEGYITDSATIPTHPSDKGHLVMGKKAIADLLAQYSEMQ